MDDYLEAMVGLECVVPELSEEASAHGVMLTGQGAEVARLYGALHARFDEAWALAIADG